MNKELDQLIKVLCGASMHRIDYKVAVEENREEALSVLDENLHSMVNKTFDSMLNEKFEESFNNGVSDVLYANLTNLKLDDEAKLSAIRIFLAASMIQSHIEESTQQVVNELVSSVIEAYKTDQSENKVH